MIEGTNSHGRRARLCPSYKCRKRAAASDNNTHTHTHKGGRPQFKILTASRKKKENVSVLTRRPSGAIRPVVWALSLANKRPEVGAQIITCSFFSSSFVNDQIVCVLMDENRLVMKVKDNCPNLPTGRPNRSKNRGRCRRHVGESQLNTHTHTASYNAAADKYPVSIEIGGRKSFPLRRNTHTYKTLLPVGCVSRDSSSSQSPADSFHLIYNRRLAFSDVQTLAVCCPPNNNNNYGRHGEIAHRHCRRSFGGRGEEMGDRERERERGRKSREKAFLYRIGRNYSPSSTSRRRPTEEINTPFAPPSNVFSSTGHSPTRFPEANIITL